MAAQQDSTYVLALPTQLIDQSVANTTSEAVDMQGYDRVKFIYQLGAMVNGSSLSTWAVESDESNLGNATNIVSAEDGTTQAALTNVPNTANNSIHVIDVYRPTKRYVGVAVDAVTANITSLGVLAERIRGTGTNPDGLVSGFQHVTVRAS